MLKTDLHLHAGEDIHHKLKYSSKKLIDYAASKGFNVLSLTFHEHVYFNKKIESYAKKKGILLIPGVERYIEDKEVLIYNVTKKEYKNLNTFDDLRKLKKRKNILIIAPHPFFLRSNCLGKKLEENIDLFDGIEYSHFYLSWFNRNKKAVKIAIKYNKTLIGTSDAHNLHQMNSTFSLVNSNPTIKSFFNAVRNNKTQLITKPISLSRFLWRSIKVVLDLE